MNNPIQNELNELNSMLAGISNRNVYTVPDGYFDASFHDILSTITGHPPISDTHFTVPAGYFDGLADTIMGKIKALPAENISPNEDPSFLFPIKGVNVYKAPAGYFDNLADDIFNKLKADVAEVESSLLSSIKGINVYHTPAGYFEGLSNEILHKLPHPAKLIEMKRPTSIFRYAAAAVITGIIGLSVISVFNKKDIAVEPVSSGTVMADANKILKTNSFDQVLSTISDDDIVKYLEGSGEDVNAAMVASISEDKNIPEEFDYLTDDKTLDNLLNGLTIDQTETN